MYIIDKNNVKLVATFIDGLRKKTAMLLSLPLLSMGLATHASASMIALEYQSRISNCANFSNYALFDEDGTTVYYDGGRVTLQDKLRICAENNAGDLIEVSADALVIFTLNAGQTACQNVTQTKKVDVDCSGSYCNFDSEVCHLDSEIDKLKY